MTGIAAPLRVAIDVRVLQQALRVTGGPGGRGRYVLELVRALIRRDDGLAYVLLADRGRLPEVVRALARPERVRLHRIGYPARLAHVLSEHGRAGAPARAAESAVIAHELRRLRPDVVHFPDQLAPGSGGRPSLLTLHDLIALDPAWRNGGRSPLGAFVRARLRATARRGDLVSCVSAATARDAERLLSIPSDRLVVCHPGVDLDQFHPGSEAEQPSSHPYFLHVGVLRERKNPEALLRAFARVAAGSPAVRLVCVGPYAIAPAAAARVEALAAKLGVGDRVELRPAREDELPALYRGSVGLVFPSFQEGFGFPILEALACGVPCVGGTGSSFPEVGGELALQIDPHNVEELANAMERLLTEEALRARARALGPEWAARFSWETTAARTAELYLRLAGRAGTRRAA